MVHQKRSTVAMRPPAAKMPQQPSSKMAQVVKPRAWSFANLLLLAILALTCWSRSAEAAYVAFSNCLDPSIVNSSPRLLQFVPLHVSAFFNTTSDKHNLNVTVYGNVTGQATEGTYPPPSNPSWSDPNNTFGKIPDLGSSGALYTTLFAHLDVLSYTPYSAQPTRFCEDVIHGDCPLAPAFFVNRTDLTHLPAFSVSHDLEATYSFTSISANLKIQSGDPTGQFYGCVTATVTPDLGNYLRGLCRFLPLAVLIVVGVATIAAAILSPWGSADIFHWSSNFGRDEDLLRLVTPGFGDCLQYIQFIVLTGSLSLNYPGFYQPVASRVGWSALMFNESFVTGGNGTQPIVDGIYELHDNTGYGLDRMSQLVGMTSPKDIWAGMIVWLVVIVAAVAILTQLAFVLRWLYRQIANVPAEDLRSKNWPFTAGNTIRVTMNYFLLPLCALSFYQLIIAGRGPAYAVALAAIVLVGVVLFAARLMLLLIRTRPRSFLFDDLLTVLMFGPLYNTYCDDAATFALLPVFVNFLRGIAIGAVQPSGIAQLVLLAICEIILIIIINAFRPFPSATSMNIYHTAFSVIRLFTILLAIAFVPSLDVGDASRGWIGYAILLIHACVLVFGFFLNAVQTLIEVIARLAGAGGQGEVGGGAARGGLVKVFGMRQLSRRMPRRDQAPRNSMASSAAMLTVMDQEQKELQMAKTRSRSISASSTMLLDGPGRNPARSSRNIEGSSAGRTTPDAASTFSKRFTGRLSRSSSPGAIVNLQKQIEAKDPYYRPPRRNTMEMLSTTDSRTNASLTSGDIALAKRGLVADEQVIDDDAAESSSTPAQFTRDDFEDATNELARTKTDYAVREVDFYYGVRGPALSSGTRKLKTGPADPTGPVSSARGWFKGLVGGKTKEKTKGFEVVRSARAPPPGLFPSTPEPERPVLEPYEDDPQSPVDKRQDRVKSAGQFSAGQHESIYDDLSLQQDSDEEYEPIAKAPTRPPSLPLIDSIGAIELPSRIGSETSRKSRNRPSSGQVPDIPALPLRSSKRDSNSHDPVENTAVNIPRARLPTVAASPPVSRDGNRSSNMTSGSGRIPFSSLQPSPAKFNRYSTGAESGYSAEMPTGDEENIPPTTAPLTNHLRHSSSALGTQHAAADRPSSMGFVQQHRASDNIHYSPESPAFEGSTAEVHGPPTARI